MLKIVLNLMHNLLQVCLVLLKQLLQVQHYLQVKQLLDFARDSVIAASSAQEAAGAFGTTFGDAAANLTKELSKNANLFGLTTSEAKQLIGVFGAVAQGMGFTQNESADLSSRLFELSGDIASFQ
jgi:adenylosuccinate lyase